jgi:predicted DCC family thiol-disulfide oxidoreductase YuxK
MSATAAAPSAPILLYNDECAVCRAIAHWVQTSAPRGTHEANLVERPIGDDPEALRALNPGLDIWDAYATIHLLMPDGSMKLGGEAVAEVLRRLPVTAWMTPAFGLGVFGVRPFQALLDGGYFVLSETRPILGCESCGTPNPWVRSIERGIAWLTTPLRAPRPAPRHPTASARRQADPRIR